MNPKRLHTILNAIRSDSISYKELVELIHFSRSIAESYLVAHRNSIFRLCEAHGISLSDLATDCIAEIFRRDDEGGMVSLKCYIEQQEEINEDSQFISYRRFIIIRMRSQLARTYAQIDGVGAKISRNLKLHLHRNEWLQLTMDFRGYVIKPRTADSLDELPAFPTLELEQALNGKISKFHTVPDILNFVSEILMQQERYRRSIPMYHLVNIIRSVYIPQEEDTAWAPETQLSGDEIAAIQRSICIELDNRIFTEYVRKEKLTIEQAKNVSVVVREIMSGWWNTDGDHESISAIAQRILNITSLEYRAMYQTKIEYLVKQAKERFRDSMEKDL